MHPIESVVFDIGRVLVDFSFDGFQSFLVRQGGRFTSKEDFIEKTHLLEYESGQLSTESFIKNVSAQLRQAPSTEEFIREWNSIFSPNNSMLTLLDALNKKFKVFLLSNTNELHWQHLSRSYSLEQRCQGAMTSFRAGTMKPRAEIYLKTAECFKLEAEKTVFIDDIAEHVATAERLGWKGICHENTEATTVKLKALGVTV